MSRPRVRRAADLARTATVLVLVEGRWVRAVAWSGGWELAERLDTDGQWVLR